MFQNMSDDPDHDHDRSPRAPFWEDLCPERTEEEEVQARTKTWHSHNSVYGEEESDIDALVPTKIPRLRRETARERNSV